LEPWYRREYPRVPAALVLVAGESDRAREAAEQGAAHAAKTDISR